MQTKRKKVKTFKPDKKVAIIGAGMLGLSLAHYLAKYNVETVIIEKSSDLGGLASGFKINDACIEKYYHHIFKSDTAIQSLLKEIGLEKDLQWIPAKMGIYLNDKSYNFSGAFDLLKFSPLPICARIRAGLVSFYIQRVKSTEKFKNYTALEWCSKYYGKTVTKALWQPLLKSKFGDKFDKVSMIWLWARLHDRGSSRPNLLADERLGYINGSFQNVVDTLEKEIVKNGVKIYKNSGLLDFQNGGRIHKLVWRDNKGKVKQDHFTHIIATILPEQFMEIFNAPKPYRKQWEKIDFIGALCMSIVLKKSVQPYYWNSINDPKAPFVALIEHTNLVDKSHYKNDTIIYLAKYLKTTDELFLSDEQKLKSIAIDFLHKVNPKFSANWIKSIKTFKAAQAQHIVTKDYQTPDYNTGIKNVYFAHFAQIFPHDRGTNYAVAQAQEIFKIIKRNN